MLESELHIAIRLLSFIKNNQYYGSILESIYFLNTD